MKKIKIICADGYELTGTLYNSENPNAAVFIGPATGIKRRFYDAFAQHLSEIGYAVLTFDNRGIGDSISGPLNDLNATLINWGRLDMTAVLEKLKSLYPDLSYHLIGHSAGGQLVGLMDNALDIKSIFNYASSSGNLRKMEYPFRFSALFFMNFYIPISNALLGKTNSQWVGMGEPLPKALAAQWSKWCNGEGYVATDFGEEIKEHFYDEITYPSLWLHATDDGIANYETVSEMADVFPNSPQEIISLDPKELGYDSLGHMGFFSSKKKELWKYAVEWLEKNS